MYSDKFLKAFDYVMQHEGGYVDDPQDKGGKTNFGISERSYPHLDIKNLTKEHAQQIYHRDFWLKGRLEEIKNEHIAIKLFDLSVNFGKRAATIILQRALRSVGKIIHEDGILGSVTLSAVNAPESSDLLVALKSEAAGHYRLIANNDSSQQKFLQGWLNRAYQSV